MSGTTAAAPGIRPRRWHVDARRGAQLGAVGFELRPRAIVAAAGCAVTLVALVGVAVLAGSAVIEPADVWRTLMGGGSDLERLLVVDRRLGRALTCLAVGAALGLAGTLTQTVTRNPIATPDILGVTTGAGFAVTLVIVLGVPATATSIGTAALLTTAALVGAAVFTLAIVALTWRGGIDGVRLVLVGLGMNAIALGGTTAALTRADLEDAAVAARWLAGSTEGARLGDLALIAPALVVLVAAVLALTPHERTLGLGREIAASLGTPVTRSIVLLLGIAVVATALATAVAGPVAFVAFVAPHLARLVFRAAQPSPVAGAVIGAALLLAADLVAARWLGALPVGVTMPLLGAPYLVLVLLRTRSPRA